MRVENGTTHHSTFVLGVCQWNGDYYPRLTVTDRINLRHGTSHAASTIKITETTLSTAPILVRALKGVGSSLGILERTAIDVNQSPINDSDLVSHSINIFASLIAKT